MQVNAGDVLEVSYVGFEKATHKVAANATSVLIKLQVAEKTLDEVVTGYSRMKKESFTGNSIQVTQKDLLKVSNRNLVDVLQVFDPSFRIEVNNVMGSDPNTLPEFYIRGRSGIGVKALDQVDVSQAALTNNPNLPIFIMDGYEVSAERVYDFDITRIKEHHHPERCCCNGRVWLAFRQWSSGDRNSSTRARQTAIGLYDGWLPDLTRSFRL